MCTTMAVLSQSCPISHSSSHRAAWCPPYSTFSIFQFLFHFILNPVLFLVGNKDPAFWPESVSPYYALPTGERYVIIFLFLIIIIKHIYLISTSFIAVFFTIKFSFCYSMSDNAMHCLASCFFGILWYEMIWYDPIYSPLFLWHLSFDFGFNLSWHVQNSLRLPIFAFKFASFTFVIIGRRSCYNDLGFCMLKSLQPYKGVILILITTAHLYHIMLLLHHIVLHLVI